MVLNTLYIIVTILIIVVIPIVIRQRKKAGVTGIQSALSSICLLLMALTNVLAYWLNLLGIVSWSVSFILLLFAAYFTKDIPASE